MSDDLQTPVILTGALQEALKFVNTSLKMLKVCKWDQFLVLHAWVLHAFSCVGNVPVIHEILSILQKKMQKRAQLQLIQSLLEVEKEVGKVLDVLGLLSSKSYAEVTHFINPSLIACFGKPLRIFNNYYCYLFIRFCIS